MLNLDITELFSRGRPPRHFSNYQVRDLDPLSNAPTLPREIELTAIDGDGARVLAIWSGSPALAVNDYVRVRRDKTASVLIVEDTGGATSADSSTATTASSILSLIVTYDGAVVTHEGEVVWQD